MSTQSDIAAIRAIMTKLDANRASKFSYTDAAFNDDVVDGVSAFDVNAEQNIPLEGYTNFNDTVRGKGVRTQGASLPRMGINHFFGRMSYNLNKLIQKFAAWMEIDIAARAHNANEYDASAPYRTGDTCYLVENKNGLRVITYFIRTSPTPDTISGVLPTNTNDWSELFDKRSGVHHKYAVADLTDVSYATNTWYPVTTTLGDFDAVVAGTKDTAMRQLIEACCAGTVAGFTNAQRVDFRVRTKFTGFSGSTTTIVEDDSVIDAVDGTDRSGSSVAPIGYTTLPIGRQAVIWLKGGSKYVLYNGFGSLFTIHTSAYANGVDASISPSVGTRPLTMVLAPQKNDVRGTIYGVTPGVGGLAALAKAATIWASDNDGTGSGLDADIVRGVTPGAGGLAALAKAATIWASDNDGAGSGLDADLFEGKHGSDYTRIFIYDGSDASANADFIKDTGIYVAKSNAYRTTAFSSFPVTIGAGGFCMIVMQVGDSFATQIFFNYGDPTPYVRNAYYSGGVVWTPWSNGLMASDNGAGTYGSHQVDYGTPWVIPKGLYMMIGDGMSGTPYIVLDIYTGSSWTTANLPPAGLILSDGVNYRLRMLNTGFDIAKYRKLS